ncbi:MAG: CCA tRNA nucleotidyltransferase [Clostridiales bacterium]|nr:CCA tRNA nucleotidyltransferase [Clostridiales bacterium]
MTVSLEDKINQPIFHHVGSVADALCRECYVVGGWVRDLFLDRHSKDIDFVTVGSGIEVAEAVTATLGKGARLSVFKNFGTAQVHYRGGEYEFVGARRESYRRDSRKPIVEDGTLTDDLSRRDLTINAMAISVNRDNYGRLIDLFGGMDDLRKGLVRTPLDPDITFSDDPLRMMRAVRFATQLQFVIVPETLDAIKRNVKRLEIISKERVVDELMKIMKSPKPSIGWRLLAETGLLDIILPELAAMRGVEVVKGRGHKDNFEHTLQVVDNVAAMSDNVWLRWAALFHDIAKPVTKRWDNAAGWTFHNHNFVGAKMLPRIFRRMKMPMDDKLKYVQQMVELHMRPIALVEDTVTDSAVRRLLVDAGENIEDLMMLCRADITSKNKEKVERHLENFAHVKEKMIELEARDKLRNWQPPVDGNLIMKVFGIPQGRDVGLIKEYVREAMLASDDPNDYDHAYSLMMERAKELGIV